MTLANVSSITPSHQNFSQQVQSQTKTHGVLWHVANIFFLGFPMLFEEIGAKLDRGSIEHEVTLLKPVSLGTDVEREVEQALGQSPKGRGALEHFFTGESDSGRQKGRLERFTVEIKNKLDSISPEAGFELLQAIRQDVENCRVQLAVLASNNPVRNQARERLELALLRREGVKIALEAIRNERIGIQRVGFQARQLLNQQLGNAERMMGKATQTYLERFGAEVVNNAVAKADTFFESNKSEVERTVHQSMLDAARNWSLKGANEQTIALAKLCESI